MKRLTRLTVVVGCVAFWAANGHAATATKVAAGSSHTCVLTTGGGVVCWGDNWGGQLGDGTTETRRMPTAVSGLAVGVVDLAAGSSHTCALSTGGGVVCWGWNGYGQLGDGTTSDRLTPTPVSGLETGVEALAAGGEFTCALTTGVGVVCWGSNGYGQLGDGTTTDRLTPTAVSGLYAGVAAVVTGRSHTCALTTGGGVMCWGENDVGQLGDGTTSHRLTPTSVNGLAADVAVVAAGRFHTCALKTDGALLCWGYNGMGQLGDGTTTSPRRTPTAVSGLQTGVVAVAAGGYFTCALTTGGAAACWGYNDSGQLGDGTTDDRRTPTALSGLPAGGVAVTAGLSHACALTTGGGVACWGRNDSGQLGDGTTATQHETPAAVSGLATGVAALTAGGDRSCALTAGGGVLCWGANESGQLGDGTTTQRQTPTAVSGLATGVAAIAAGGTCTCALTTDGHVLCWPDGASLTPSLVNGLPSGVTALTAGLSHVCALTNGGDMVCWGENYYGQLGDGTTTRRQTPTAVTGLPSGVTAAAAGQFHTCALTTIGGVVCWGRNRFGQLGDGTTTDRLTPAAVSGLETGVVALAAGGDFTCALTTGGGVLCWGENYSGQLGDGTMVSRLTPTAVNGLATGVTAVAAGRFHICALTTGGGVRCWGDNGWGQVGDGTTSPWCVTPTEASGLATGVVALATGQYHTCALTTAGGVLCWGDDRRGQLGLGTRWWTAVPVNVYGYGGVITATALSPDAGLSTGGTAVTLSGLSFLQGATVSLGGVPATHVVVVNTETITARTGPHAPGTVDIVVTNPDGTQATLPGAFTYGAGGAGAGSDFTGDLKADILWRHATLGELWLWPMSGAARTAETYLRTVADTNYEIRAAADFDGNGSPDLLWRNKVTGAVYIWPMEASILKSESYVATIDPAYDIVGTGDFNGDGKADILWRHTANGEVWVWLMDGATPLIDVYVETVDPAYLVKGVGDVNADGKADIVWHHATLGEVWVWLMEGTTRLSATWIGSVPDVGYQIVGVADFTGDGKADVLWHHDTAGEVWLWPMNGTTRVSETWVGTVPDTGYQPVGTGDYDGDGKADILWHHATLGEVWVWLMDGPTRRSETWVGTVPDLGYQIVKMR
jgi:alpha-tubulin suppressor-like RCC1 family protein